ncbi:Kef-type potassium/proton antiporter, CPA2 family [Sulfuricurvum kujiense DSM 16994]|uniref:Kef-type potassium/proton antiporter, CPA2 family n=1 Tax=Sulfuricurvum kujiense (strain ATCC BAA-921 / DSM 16994 / JCM 11577 / YK-1) TaxID=709032 RepID=E4TXK0_SULKY|nr:cation:proton antiporter [Sulfuricurvum kujiense]ADR33909.1 Kef-type potassium/proton antiporter, CPA2 family [Sulfuricurvum kujiense DSM 16994]
MLAIIVTTLLLSLLINIFLRKIYLPTIIGYILTGTLIAYLFNLHEAIHNHELKEIAEFGVVFLMFTIGLEFSLAHLKRMKHEVFITGTLQIFLTSSIVFFVTYYALGFEQKSSIIISIVIALSSTAIVLKLLNESGEINRRHGQRAMGILIMQDIAVIPILLIIGFMSGSTDDISSALRNMLVSAVALLAFLWIFGKYILEPFLTQIFKTNSDELFVGSVLFLAIGASYVAHFFGFSYSLGAFVAGMLIAETKYKHQAEADLIPFRDLLLGIFFITVGMQIDFFILIARIHIILALLLGVMVLKFIIIFGLIRVNESKRVSLKTAFSLVQIGEFSLAILELARSNELIAQPYGQIMIATIVLSMIITPLILKHLTPLTDMLQKQEDEQIEHLIDSDGFKNHTVILGFGEFGRNVAAALKEKGEFYLAIENNINTFHAIQKMGEPAIFGNTLKKEVLKKANIQMAKYVIVAIDNPAKLYHVCQTIQQFVDSSKIIVKVHTQHEKNIIAELGISNIIIENDVMSQMVSRLIMKSE